MIGAGSAMGPFEKMLELGATVVALARPRPALWRNPTLATTSLGSFCYYRERAAKR